MLLDCTTKVCNRCGEEKPLSEYHARSASKDGRAFTCKTCVSVYGKAKHLRLYKPKRPPFDPLATEQACRRCGVVKPLAAFNLLNKSKAQKNGRLYDRLCKACKSAEEYATHSRHNDRDPNATEKVCNLCGQLKPLSEFHLSKARDGHAATCRVCWNARVKERRSTNPEVMVAFRERNARYRQTHPDRTRDYHLKSTYGLELGQYAQMLAAQGGGCALCGMPPNGKPLVVDHDHDSGKVRGLLCARCNMLVGFLETTELAILERVSAYLASPSL